MGVKLTINGKESRPEKPHYPRLMQNRQGHVFYVARRRKGVNLTHNLVIKDEITDFESEHFTPFNGTITLENK